MAVEETPKFDMCKNLYKDWKKSWHSHTSCRLSWWAAAKMDVFKHRLQANKHLMFSWVFKVACLSHDIQQTWLLKSSMHAQHCKFQSSRDFLFNSNSGWRMQRLAEKRHEVLCRCHTFFHQLIFSCDQTFSSVTSSGAWPSCFCPS